MFWLLVLMILTALGEVVSIGSALPFLAALGNTKRILESPGWQPFWKSLGVTESFQVIGWLALGFGVAVLASNALRLVTLWCQNTFSAALTSDLSCEVYRRTLHQPYSFHVRHSSDEHMAIFSYDIFGVNTFLSGILGLMVNSIVVLFLFISIVVINPLVALGATAFLGIIYIVVFRLTRNILVANGQLLTSQNQILIKFLQEGLGGIRDVILEGSQGLFEGRFRKSDRLFRRALSKNIILIQCPRILIEAAAMIFISILAVVMSYKVDDLSQVLTTLGILALAANRLLPALQICFSSVAGIKSYEASTKKVIDALYLQVPSSGVALPPLPIKKDIRFENVWFRYSEEHPWVLQGLSLAIQVNTTVGFVGSTGSGKSTTADLILGLLQPDKGQVLIDGQPLTSDRLRSWQRSIAHVPQHIFLSDTTVAENIAFGVPANDIDLSRVRWAAEMAQISEFIESRPEGYQAIVGERGVRLSGGQRQRIGIARALYKKASVIVLDEATSALDNATEREVMAAVERLSGEVTVILIAHRLSTVEKCDLIIELEQGHVAAQGSYQDLLSYSETFKRMAGVV
ncbi:MAG: ABC transporter ATP-binding protein/permease [Cyanobacteria bacterium REEB459]|nr:ABC transporter ATP-binding protein/permease [Cyanobacteria bacterium REEB459]